VSVERAGAQLMVTLDGRARRVDAARLDETTLSLIFPDEGGASYEVGLEREGPGELAVHIAGSVLRAQVDGTRNARSRRAAVAGADAHGAGPEAVVSPMPGKVVRVLVAPGDRVAARQGLVVVEAMKMENELRAPKPGVVTAVNVREGMSVEARSVLVVVE
jgi:biotin carboxyl carrier protein